MNDATERERAPHPATTDSRTLVSPRSPSCGTECQTRPCTLRDMRRAHQTLHDQPWLRLWAQLTILAHLTGWPAPVPDPTALATAKALHARTLQCAISHALDTAAATSPAIPAPKALAAHASAAIRARTEHGQWLCPPEEPEWLLPDPVATDIARELLRPAGTTQTVPRANPLTNFIDCQWPLQYLPTD